MGGRIRIRRIETPACGLLMASLTSIAIVSTAPVSRAPCKVIAKAEFAPQKKAVLKGQFSGYFGSLTSLKNDLPPGQRGECEVNNQLDQRVRGCL